MEVELVKIHAFLLSLKLFTSPPLSAQLSSHNGHLPFISLILSSLCVADNALSAYLAGWHGCGVQPVPFTARKRCLLFVYTFSYLELTGFE
jgi:hypothetical protein